MKANVALVALSAGAIGAVLGQVVIQPDAARA